MIYIDVNETEAYLGVPNNVSQTALMKLSNAPNKPSAFQSLF